MGLGSFVRLDNFAENPFSLPQLSSRSRRTEGKDITDLLTGSSPRQIVQLPGADFPSRLPSPRGAQTWAPHPEGPRSSDGFELRRMWTKYPAGNKRPQ